MSDSAVYVSNGHGHFSQKKTQRSAGDCSCSKESQWYALERSALALTFPNVLIEDDYPLTPSPGHSQSSESEDSSEDGDYSGENGDGDEDTDGDEEQPSLTPATTTAPTPSSKSPRPKSASTTPRPHRPNIYACTYSPCTKSFNRPCRLADHLRSHTKDRPFACAHQGCEKAFMRKVHLTRHVSVAHTGTARTFQCDWPGCGKAFVSGQRLRRHEDTHTGKYRCEGHPPCAEVFRKLATLQAHVNAAHLGRKKYPCARRDAVTGEVCPAAFDVLRSLRAHVARDHDRIPRFFCTICAPATGDADADVPGTSPDSGPAMGPALLGFVTYADLQSHVRAAHPPTCPHCALALHTPRELRRHVELAHGLPSPPPLDPTAPETLVFGGVPGFYCPHPGCGRSFSREGNLLVHAASAHPPGGGGRAFVCGAADLSRARCAEVVAWWKATATEHGLEGRRSGTGTGSGCGASFRRRADLVAHVRETHLGLPPPSRRERKRGAVDGAPAGRKRARRNAAPSLAAVIAGLPKGAEAGGGREAGGRDEEECFWLGGAGAGTGAGPYFAVPGSAGGGVEWETDGDGDAEAELDGRMGIGQDEGDGVVWLGASSGGVGGGGGGVVMG